MLRVDPLRTMRPNKEYTKNAASAGKGRPKGGNGPKGQPKGEKTQLCFAYANGNCKFQDAPHLCSRLHDPQWAIIWRDQQAKEGNGGGGGKPGKGKGKGKGGGKAKGA